MPALKAQIKQLNKDKAEDGRKYENLDNERVADHKRAREAETEVKRLTKLTSLQEKAIEQASTKSKLREQLVEQLKKEKTGAEEGKAGAEVVKGA